MKSSVIPDIDKIQCGLAYLKPPHIDSDCIGCGSSVPDDPDEQIIGTL